MKCKNCGAAMKDNARVCQNCGAFAEDSKGYMLLSSDDVYYSSDRKKEKTKKSKKGFKYFLILLLVIAVAGGGSYYYFTNIHNKQPEKPEISFLQGTGYINDNEPVVYVKFDSITNVEYIHSVSLYNYDKTQKGAPDDAPVTNNYEYTKNIDSTFRAIFFDAESLKLTQDVNYTYTFEINLSFVGESNVYTYNVPVKINSDFKKDVSDEIFDHSMDKDVDSKITSKKSTVQKTTLPDIKNADYIYEGYWFTSPVKKGGNQSISSYRFNKDNTLVRTDYARVGSGSWNITTKKGTYSSEDGYIIIEQEDNSKSIRCIINVEEKSLITDSSTNGEPLVNRKYNSVTNVEDFFAE